MKMSGMGKMVKTLVFPLAICGMFLAGTSAWAQGNIMSITKYPTSGYTAPITVSGQTVEFRIRLYSTTGTNFTRIYSGPYATDVAAVLSPFEIKVLTGNGEKFAQLVGINDVDKYRTDMRFQYTVQPGDMAFPMKLYGNGGSDTVGVPYSFNDGQWRIYNPGNNSNVVWRFGTVLEGVADPTFARANVTLRTLNFETSDWSVQASKTIAAKVTADAALSDNVAFYVWSSDTNIAKVVNTASPTYMAAGNTESLFYIRGVAEGTAQIYLSPESSLTDDPTNYVAKTVTVSPPPAPTVSVSLPGMDIGNALTVLEGSANYLTVKLSEAYAASDLWIRLDASSAGNITFDTSPKYVKIAKGDTESAAVAYTALDGTLTSYQSGVVITPVLTNTTADVYFSNKETATVKVLNVAPTLTSPETNDVFQANRQIACSIPWAATDVVEADTTNNLTITWQFGDGTQSTITTGAVGTVMHTYSSTGTKTVKATLKDKDGGSVSSTFTVEVTEAVPQPSVRVETVYDTYSETTDKSSGQLRFVLSEPYTAGNVYVRLAVDQAETNLTFTTLGPVMIANGATNSPYLKFSISDGTDISASTGVGLTPVITNDLPKAYYVAEQRWIWVTNAPPVLTRVMGSRLDAITNVVQASATIEKAFSFEVSDVDADLNPVTTRWNFGDNTGDFTATAVSNRSGFAQGVIRHTYGTAGIYTVSVQAEDKDGGVSDLFEFTIQVSGPPSVYVITPADAISENSEDENTIIVRLTSGFTNAVTVDLSIAPANSSANGWIGLYQTSVVFPAVSADLIGTIQERTVAISNVMDGTTFSRYSGFTITPTVSATTFSQQFYGANLYAGTVKIKNEAPEITYPAQGDLTADTYSYTVTLGDSTRFYWTINDVDKDGPKMKVTWTFSGESSVQTLTGASGWVDQTFSSAGEQTVYVHASDGDGGSDDVSFKIMVAPGKTVIVTPAGPNETVTYYGVTGLGNGTVVDDTARWYNKNDIYYFNYGPSIATATLRAIPYKTGAAGYYNVVHYDSAGVAVTDTTPINLDSFFFVWVGSTDQGLAAGDMVPGSASSSAAVTLPTSTTSTDGTTTSVEARNIKAIFSREWREADNVGDINQDGIPDATASSILASMGDTGDTGDTTDTTGTTAPSYLKAMNAFNEDTDADGNAVGDFLPVNPTGVGGVYDFRAIADPTTADGAIPVNAFTALREVRGYDLGLNKDGVSDPDGPEDEPGTDPSLVDTDSDGYPDGWEYWFWYQAQFGSPKWTGEAYNPLDVGKGTLIPFTKIIEAFDPTSARGTVTDFDGDGLTDAEELTIGTDPTHWDTDGDGMCDTWEVMRALNPCDPADATLNVDGDYMAEAVVTRQMVNVVTGGTKTNSYLAVGAAEGTNTGSYTTWYYYGATNNGIIAVGRPVTLDPGAVVVGTPIQKEAILLHAQVMRAFGFDPRTAWTSTMNFHPEFDRFPTWISAAANTEPFTALDEYLVMEYIAENRLNDYDPDTGFEATASVWKNNSTDPQTPDTDVTETKQDGMPDGWELYVGLNPAGDLATAAGRRMTISPWSPLEDDTDDDKLKDLREFAGTDSSAAYTNAAQYASSNFVGVVSINRPASDETWVNKYWPTNPWSKDTDGDGLEDPKEQTFIYGTPTDNHGTCVQGGGLNPLAIDTDLDGLPDKWENDFTATNGLPVVGTAVTNTPAITNGMDGTYADASYDWDGDGLKNYQEYWVQAVRCFRYDIPLETHSPGGMTGNTGLPMDASFGASSLFTQVTNNWDLSKYPWGDANPNLWVLLPVGPAKQYVSTDPRDHDTDLDGMDDYYELFHGLNPILGFGILASGLDDRVARAYIDHGAFTLDYGSSLGNDFGKNLPMDFRQYPWLAGMPEADPDADGLLNLEEMLQADAAAPSPSNTDPTPMWFTDFTSANDVCALSTFYLYNGMFFWPGTETHTAAYKMFAFEMNEGYDTDNDGISDKTELMVTTTAQSDPQDPEDPVRRQALWFDGQQSAAQTLSQSPFNQWSFRSFTVELWACPEEVGGGKDQVLIERPMVYSSGELSTTGYVVRVNFRLGIAGDGRVYGMFQNAGVHDEVSGHAVTYGPVLTTNQWVHIALRMDGDAGKLELFVHDRSSTTFGPCDIVATKLVPANGVLAVLTDPSTAQYPEPYRIVITQGVLVLGASNISPYSPLFGMATWADYTDFYHGYLDEIRVWDGARTDTELQANFTKRMVKSDLMDNRTTVHETEIYGGSRISGASLQLPAELVHHFTFDNLFGSDRVLSVAKVPRGFNYSSVAANRPDGYIVGWWGASFVHSDVYTDYGYIPWIEDNVAHLPLFGGITVDAATSNLVVHEADTVMDSVYWSTYSAGGVSPSVHDQDTYSFPNSNNPYTFYYWNNDVEDSSSLTTDTGRGTGSDLLPLGNAFAKQAPVMWDSDSPASVWADTGDDTDADGLPDWWETLRGLDPNSADDADGWYGDADGDGITNGENYLRDIANGWRMGDTVATGPTGLVQTADVDGDGLPDWWEAIYNLSIETDLDAEEVILSENGTLGDPDKDGLSNYAEYMISQMATNGFPRLSPVKFKTSPTQTVSDYFLKVGKLYLGEMFSDHDFVDDSWEDLYDLNYVSRFVYDAHLDNDEDGWSNWSEARYGTSTERSNPTLISHLSPLSTQLDDYTLKDYPIPQIEVTLSYNGLRPSGQLQIEAFSDPAMDGLPDAVFTMPAADGSAENKSKQIGYWGATSVQGTLAPGSIIPGTVVLQFTDTTPTPMADSGGTYWSLSDRTVDVAADVNGVIKARSATGLSADIGTIDYLTGKYTIDFSSMEGWTLRSALYSQEGTMTAPKLDVSDAFVLITYQVEQVSTWPKTLYLAEPDMPSDSVLSLGRVKEGLNYFFAFIDLNANNDWDAGEPCGVSEGFGVNIGYDRNVVKVGLSDYTLGYLRMTLSPAERSEDVFSASSSSSTSSGSSSSTASSTASMRLRVVRTQIDGSSSYGSRVIFDKTIQSRGYLHEGDLFGSGMLSLDWGFPGMSTSLNPSNITYNVVAGDSSVLTNNVLLTFTNTYDGVRAKAVTTLPVNGGYVYSCRPTFRWTMPVGYTAFSLEIKRGSSSGPTVYTSGTLCAPKRNNSGECVWTAPIYADSLLPDGEIFLSNQVYAWRVIAMNAKFSSTTSGWSDWKKFRLDVNLPIESSGYGAINARVKYYGPATTLLQNCVRVQAFCNAGFTGDPAGEYVLTGTDLAALTATNGSSVNAVLKGLLPSTTAGDYYLRAFIDANNNGVRDVWESWGYANYYGVSTKPYDPRPIDVTYAQNASTVDIIIEDADTDQDWFPDAYEYAALPDGDFLANMGPSTNTTSSAEINPDLTTDSIYKAMSSVLSTLSVKTTDQDGDGLSDFAELLLGSDALNASSAGDGYTDGAKAALGLAPTDTLNLNVTGLTWSGDDALKVNWTVGVQTTGISDSEVLGLVSETAAGGDVPYRILYTESLLDPQWVEVGSGTVKLSGVQALTTEVGNTANAMSPAQGFFRVTLGNP